MTVAKLICSWHSTRGSVPNQEHFFRALGRSVRDLRTRKGTRADSANSAASRLLKNRFSYHDARYNDLARWNSRALRGCNHTEGWLGGLMETITASVRISFPRSCQPASDR